MIVVSSGKFDNINLDKLLGEFSFILIRFLKKFIYGFFSVRY